MSYIQYLSEKILRLAIHPIWRLNLVTDLLVKLKVWYKCVMSYISPTLPDFLYLVEYSLFLFFLQNKYQHFTLKLVSVELYYNKSVAQSVFQRDCNTK